MTDYTTTGISYTGNTAKTEVCESSEGDEGTYLLIHDNTQCIDCVTLEELEQIEEIIHDFVALRKE